MALKISTKRRTTKRDITGKLGKVGGRTGKTKRRLALALTKKSGSTRKRK